MDEDLDLQARIHEQLMVQQEEDLKLLEMNWGSDDYELLPEDYDYDAYDGIVNGLIEDF